MLRDVIRKCILFVQRGVLACQTDVVFPEQEGQKKMNLSICKVLSKTAPKTFREGHHMLVQSLPATKPAAWVEAVCVVSPQLFVSVHRVRGQADHSSSRDGLVV